MAMRGAACSAVLVVLAASSPSVSRAATEREGVAGPIAWRVADFSLTTASIDGQNHATHAFTLGLKSTTAGALTLTRYEARVSYAGLAELALSQPLHWSLESGAEGTVTLQSSLPCGAGSGACRSPIGPTWAILVLGSDQRGRPIREVIAFTLPAAPGKPLAPPPKISRAPTPASASSSGAIPIRVSNNLIFVTAVVNGSALSLLLDTGAQVTVLGPDVATRLGIVVPSDAPTFPLVGLGAADAPIVIVPSIRVGDHVVENLPVAVMTLALMGLLSPGSPVDGVLGGNFMSFFRMTLDWRAKVLRLEPTQ